MDQMRGTSGSNIIHALHIKRRIIDENQRKDDKLKLESIQDNVAYNGKKFTTLNKCMFGRVGGGIFMALNEAYFLRLTVKDVKRIAKGHPIPCMLILSLVFFMGVEYTLWMVPSSSPPVDVGFILTEGIHEFLAMRPNLNSVMAAFNTVFVVMQTAYILWTLLVEGRPRSTVAALFMFTSRGILGYATQLPLPQDFLGSGVDFPVGNVSFFLFFSGHVGGSMIASLDMRRMKRYDIALAFDCLNILQSLRLLATRGHYTIDLVVGLGAGFLFDTLAAMYVDAKREEVDGGKMQRGRTCCDCRSK